MKLQREPPSSNLELLRDLLRYDLARNEQDYAPGMPEAPAGEVDPGGPVPGTDEYYEMMEVMERLRQWQQLTPSDILPSVPLRGQPVNDAGAQRRGLHDDYSGDTWSAAPRQAPLTPVDQLLRQLGVMR